MELIESTDTINVSSAPLLIFGSPGCGKTSLLQTAKDPLTLDFDVGIHRAGNRKRALRFSSWSEQLLAAGTDGQYKDPKTGLPIPYQTLGLDTGGRAIDAICREVIAQSPPKQPWQYNGSLSQPGWGELGKRFTIWLQAVKSWGKDIVMICHEDEKKRGPRNADATEYACDLPGRMAWKEIHKSFDMIGRIYFDGKERILDFNPSEDAPCCKNAAQLPRMKLPDLHVEKLFLADLIAQVKLNVGKTAESSARMAKAAEEWDALLQPLASAEPAKVLEALNTVLAPKLGGVTDKIEKLAAWHNMQALASRAGLVFDKEAKLFKGGAA